MSDLVERLRHQWLEHVELHNLTLDELAQLERENAALWKDARRYRLLKHRLHGADFMYGEDEIPVILFDWPYAVSGDLDKTIDAAMERERRNDQGSAACGASPAPTCSAADSAEKGQ